MQITHTPCVVELDKQKRIAFVHGNALQDCCPASVGQTAAAVFGSWWQPALQQAIDDALNGKTTILSLSMPNGTISVMPSLTGALLLIQKTDNSIAQHDAATGKTEEKLALLSESERIGNLGSWERNMQTGQLLWSDQLYRIYGIEPQSVQLTSEYYVNNFVHPDDQQKVFDHIRSIYEHNNEQPIEIRIITSDGEKVVLSQANIIKDASGTVTVYRGIVRDITEQKKVEEQLKEQRHFIESVTGAMPEIISVIEVPSRRLTYFNHEPLAMTGFTTEELSKMSHEERLSYLVHPDDRDVLNNYYKRLESLMDDSSVTVEYRFRKKGGGTFWFQVRGRVFRRDKNGLPTHTLNIGQDITVQKMAAGQIKDQLNFINQVAVTLPDMLSVIDLKTHALSYVNTEPFSLNSFNADEIAGMSRTEKLNLIHPDDHDLLNAYFSNFKEHDDSMIQEIEYRAKAGDEEPWQWFRVRGKVFKRNAQGNATHCVNIIQNINERKTAEQEILNMKDELAKRASDRYRTLFNAMDEGYILVEILFDNNNKPVDILYLEANNMAVKMAGVELAGKRASKLNYRHEQQWLEIYSRVARTGVAERHEMPIMPTFAIYDIYVFKVGEAHESKVAVIYRDITERKKTERILKLSEERQTYLLKLMDAIRPLSDPDEIQLTASSVLAKHLGANRAGYAVDTGDGTTLSVTCNYTSDVPGIEGLHKYSNYDAAMLKLLQNGETIVRNDVINDPSLTSKEKEIRVRLALAATASAPLLRAGKLAAIFFVHFKEPHVWNTTELALVSETSERAWTAVEMARAADLMRKTEEKHLAELEQKVSERTTELKASMELMQSVFDTSLIQMMVLRAVRDETNAITDFRILFVNRELEKETNRTDLVGKLYINEYPGIRASGVFNSMIRVVETGKPARLEYFYPFDGFNKWYSCMYVKADDGIVATNLDITEQKNASQALIDLGRRQQKEIMNAIISAQEQERERIGESLHNGVAQLLYGMQTRLQLLSIKEPANERIIKDVMSILHSAITDTRKLSFELVPAILKGYGIETALKTLCQKIITDKPLIRFRFGKSRILLPEPLDFAVYRMAQELINNIIKHADAEEGLVELSIRNKNLFLTVSDNGNGFDHKGLEDKQHIGIGLQSVKNRVRLLDGSFSLRSSSTGTIILIRLPIE